MIMPGSKKVRGPAGAQASRRKEAVPGLRPSRYPPQLCDLHCAVRPAALAGFAMERQIETLELDVLGHAQPDEDIDDLEDDQRHDAVVDEHGADADGLVHDLHCIAFKQASRAAVLLDGKHASEQGAGSSADRMHAEGIERVIGAKHML